MFKLFALLMVSPAWPYPDCENDLSQPPCPYPDYGNDIWSKFSIYIRIIANLRPKIKKFIRTLERPTREFSGVLPHSNQVQTRKWVFRDHHHQDLNPGLGLFLSKANFCSRSTLIGQINSCISPATQGTVGRPEGRPKNWFYYWLRFCRC